ncbi:hypothetical protein J6590_012426 [Homalodisca vitripennis]|nr:hypothetical protein J6590_012426 [Homalodisca vitripennis]
MLHTSTLLHMCCSLSQWYSPPQPRNRKRKRKVIDLQAIQLSKTTAPLNSSTSTSACTHLTATTYGVLTLSSIPVPSLAHYSLLLSL